MMKITMKKMTMIRKRITIQKMRIVEGTIIVRRKRTTRLEMMIFQMMKVVKVTMKIRAIIVKKTKKIKANQTNLNFFSMSMARARFSKKISMLSVIVTAINGIVKVLEINLCLDKEDIVQENQIKACKLKVSKWVKWTCEDSTL